MQQEPLTLDDIQNKIGHVTRDSGAYVVHLTGGGVYNKAAQGEAIGELFDKLVQYIDQEREAVNTSVIQTPPAVVLDLTGVEYFKEEPLSKLLALAMKLRQRDGGEVTVAVPDSRVRENFRITRMDKFMKIVSSMDDVSPTPITVRAR